MAPVVKELRKYSGRIAAIVCVTAQHREMLDQVLHLFDISPEYDLGIMNTNHIVENLKREIENFSAQIKVEKVGKVL